jgi:acyl carrier protein
VSDICKRLNQSPQGKRRPLLQAHIREQSIRILGLSDSSPLDTRLPLQQLGLDSLMAVELRNTLSATLQHKLPSTLLFDYPTVDALTDFLAQELWPVEKPAAQVMEPEISSPEARAAAGEVENLSDEDAETLLLAELDALKNEKKNR